MACFVHDRQFLSKFHATVNQLRRTKEFTVNTLRQLPSRCCSCPAQSTAKKSTAAEPVLTSVNIDALKVICLWLELQQSAATNAGPSQSKTLYYTVLPFPTLLEPKEQAIISTQFLMENDKRLCLLQQIHHVHFQFVTSASSEELTNAIIQLKCNLIAQCSGYLEAIQAINGLWIIMSTEDESHIDIVKYILQQYWRRFIVPIDTNHTDATYDWRQNLPLKVTDNTCSRKRRSMIRYRNMLNRQEAIKQAIQRKKIVTRQPSLTRRQAWYSSDDEIEECDSLLLEDLPTVPQSTCWFRYNRYQECSKNRLSRSHRRQQILAFAILA
jgi:hypothetical protein